MLTFKRLHASNSLHERMIIGSRRLTQPVIPAVIVTEYDICCQQLRSVLDRECAVGFLCICCAISILSTRLRPLHKEEITAAVKLNTSMCGESADHFCLSVSNQMMVENSNGVVDFVNSRMKDFLQTFHIRGIDTSHKTIANICKMQHDLDNSNVQQTLAFEANLHVNSAFSGYADKYWRMHQKQAYD